MDNTYEEGFDNNVSQLSVSPALVDRYLTAARQISRVAVGIAPAGPTVERYKVHLNLIQDERVSEDLPFGSQGGIAVRHNFPADGEYQIKIRLQTNYNDYIRGWAGTGWTARSNVLAFRRWVFRPRVMIDVSSTPLKSCE